MLKKLLKYDLKYMIKNMSVFYILAIFFAITTRLLSLFEHSYMIEILTLISSGCVIAMIANIIINVMMRSWVRFRDSLYKDEAYLTHTLPVTKNDLYNSKLLQTLIFFLVGFAVALLTLFVAYYTKDTWQMIKEYIMTITTGMNMSTAFFIIIAIVLIFLELYNAIQCGFLGIILGYKRNNGKLGFSVLYGFISYLVAQTLVLGLVFIYGLFDSTVMELFKSVTININVNAFKVLAIVSSILYIVIILSMSIICKKLLNKGVNIE
jgi:hypothetical protein